MHNTGEDVKDMLLRRHLSMLKIHQCSICTPFDFDPPEKIDVDVGRFAARDTLGPP